MNKMKNKIAVFLALVLALIVCSLCSCANSDQDNFVGDNVAKSSAGNNYSIVTSTDRKIAYSAYVTLYVDSIQQTLQTLDSVCQQESIGGYVGNRRQSDGRASVQYRIPVEHLTEFLNLVDSNGQVDNYSIYADDITDQYYTAKERCDYLKVCKQDLENLLSATTDTEAKASIRVDLAKIVTELATYEKQFNTYQTNVSYSNVEVTLYQNDTYQEPTFLQKLSQTLFGSAQSIGDFFGGLVIVIVAILPYAVLFAVLLGIYALIKYLVCKSKGKKFVMFEAIRMRRLARKLKRQQLYQQLQEQQQNNDSDKQKEQE